MCALLGYILRLSLCVCTLRNTSRPTNCVLSMKIHVKTLVNFCVHLYSQCNELYNTQVLRGTLIAGSSFEQNYFKTYTI